MGTPFNDLKNDQWVWLCDWEFNPPKEIPPDRPPPPRIAAKVVGDPTDAECTVKPIWGDVCFKCQQFDELNPANGTQPETIKCVKDGKEFLLKMEPSNVEGRQDMTDLAELGVGELMHCLRMRYKQDPMIIYTYVGVILIAMNPMRDIGLTKLEVKQLYHGKKLGDPSIPPNIYGIGDAAYHAMVDTNQDQAIVISGESGAGKSESTKQVLEYITYCSSLSGTKGEVNEQILATSETLEAFGNAKTKRNHNSSRFGKLVTIQFSMQHGILGAEIVQYLLEKSRIVNQEVSERNYHIFYQMIVGLSAEDKAKYKLREVKDYKFLVREDGGNNDSWMNRPDGQSLGDEKNAKEIWGPGGFAATLKLSADFIDCLYRCMSAVILIGELDFKAKGQAAEFNADVMKDIAELLQIDPDAFSGTLLKKKVATSFKEFNQQQAKDNAGSLAKGLYGSFFVAMVEDVINKEIGTTEKCLFIGVLDIFGFESFEEHHKKGSGAKVDKWIDTNNKFEQLCINLTNEQLQNYFYLALIPTQLKIYQEEGLTVKEIYWANNQPCLDMCMTTKRSLFNMLDEATKAAENQAKLQENPELADKLWLENIKKQYKTAHKNLARIEGARMKDMVDFLGYHERDLKHRKDETDFCVYHYAGQVWYTCLGAVESNKNKLSPDLTDVICSSKDPFIAQLLAVKEGQKTFSTVAAMFSASLLSLNAKLLETNPFFVRCVKPNCIMQAGGFLEDHKVLNQLVCAGMTAVIEMRKNGYPVVRTAQNIIDDYQVLEDDKSKLEGKSPEDVVRYLCKMVEDEYNDEVQNVDNMAPWQVGKTKIFMKDEMFKAMNKAMAKAKAALREKQRGAVEHIKALYKMAREIALLPERQEFFEKNKVKLARKRELCGPPHNLTPEQAMAKIEEEEKERLAKIEAEYKGVHFDPVEAAVGPLVAGTPSIISDHEEFIGSEKNEERRTKCRTRADELSKKTADLQKIFGIFEKDFHDEAAEERVNALLAEVKDLQEKAKAGLEEDKAARKYEEENAARLEKEEKEKERQDKLRAEEEARLAEEKEKKEAREAELRRQKEERERAEKERKAKIEAEKERRRAEKDKERQAKEAKRREIMEAKEKELSAQRKHAELERARLEKEEKQKEKQKKEDMRRKRKADNEQYARANALITSTYVKYKDLTCKVCFIGKLPYEDSPEFVGIMFPDPSTMSRPISSYGEMSDGSVHGIQMFPCPTNRGKFISNPEKNLMIVVDSTGEFELNDLVWQVGTERVGRVRFYNKVHFDKRNAKWLGVELDPEYCPPGLEGKNDGSVEGKHYFDTRGPKTGIMGRPHKFCLVQPWTEEFVLQAVAQWKVLHDFVDDDSDDSDDIELDLEQDMEEEGEGELLSDGDGDLGDDE